MSRVVGTRVIRGPDWMWGDQDGGESHLGTITGNIIIKFLEIEIEVVLLEKINIRSCFTSPKF